MEFFIGFLTGVLIVLGINLNRKVGKLMADFQEFSGNSDALGESVAELAREVAVLVSNGPGVITQEQLDSLNEKVKAVGQAAEDADPNP